MNLLKQKLYFLVSSPEQDPRPLIGNTFFVWEQDPCKALKDLPCKITWPELDKIFEILPELKSIFQNMQELSPKIIVQKITPIHPNLNDEEFAQMQALNDIWTNNFYLYVTTLVKAELWLQRCKKIHGKILFSA